MSKRLLKHSSVLILHSTCETLAGHFEKALNDCRERNEDEVGGEQSCLLECTAQYHAYAFIQLLCIILNAIRLCPSNFETRWVQLHFIAPHKDTID